MTNHATPNLPSRNFDKTEQFYASLGFSTTYRDAGWLVMNLSGLQLEFFSHPELDPLTSWFSCCLRVDDLDAFYTCCKASGIAELNTGAPRLHPPAQHPAGVKMAALIDLDGSLLRLIEN